LSVLPDIACADEATLRRCLCDVLALSTLPSVWAGAQPLRIAESLADALYSMLSADFVYVALRDPRGSTLASVAQTDRYESNPQLAATLGPALLGWVRQHDPYDLFLSAAPHGEIPLRVTCRPLGHNAELGVLAAGFIAAELPSPLHHLLLDVGATQATTGLSNALLVHSARQSEERFRALIEASAQIVWTRGGDGVVAVEDSPSWRASTGQTEAEWKGVAALDAVHPEDRPRILALWSAAVAEKIPIETEYRLRHASGEWRWTAVRAVPRLDESGAVQEWVGMNTDISARKAAEQTQQLLLGELNHRVKNTLANVQAIAQHTLRHAKGPADFAHAFGGRVQALARVHTQLTDATWQGADLQALIADQVLQVSNGTQQLATQGPDLMLAPQAALHLALVLHELGTNSRKYGALSKPEGRVAVTWAVKSDRLHLQWSERGGPPVKVPRQHGFGTVLIQNTAQSLGGTAQMDCVAEGLGWAIDVPLKALRAPAGDQPGVTDDHVPGMAGVVEVTEPLTGEAHAQGFGGKRVLVVEDEVLVSMVVIDMLEELGVRPVGPAQSVAQALEAIASEALDAALLDGNLAGARVDAVAAALTRKEVPFAFVTGYARDNLPAAFRSAPILPKPFTEAELIAALRGLFRSGTSGTIPLRRRPGAAE
jgi:PAS domain S-box-containing protein